MRSLGRLILTRARWVLVGALLFAVAAAAVGGSVEKHLSSGGFTLPGWESSRAATALERQFGTGVPNLVLLVRTSSGSVDDSAVAATARDVERRLSAERGVTGVTSYWSLGSPTALRSTDGRSALVLARIPGNEDTVRHVAQGLPQKYDRRIGTVAFGLTGSGPVFAAITQQSKRDLQRAELLTTPITALLLLLVFGGAVAAGLPLVVGGLAVLGTFLVLRLVGAVTDVSIFALNLTTALGLGLAIDYALFVVSRYREELRHGRDRDVALLRTMHTAGRTVVFSAVTVGVSLGSMLLFPLPFLRSFAYAGIAVVTLAAVGAIVVLPAVLTVLGPRIERFAFRRHVTPAVTEGFWYRRTHAVMRHPWPVVAGSVAFLVVLGLPFLQLRIGDNDDRVLATSASARQVADDIRAQFPDNNERSTTSVVAVHEPSTAALTDYAARLSALPHVVRVDTAAGHFAHGALLAAPDPSVDGFARGGGVWLSVVGDVDQLSPEGTDLAQRIRDTVAPVPVLVGGEAATLLDSRASLWTHLPWALGVIALTTFVLLFLMVGSVVVPLKALALNVLSLSATFGALVWVFQQGHFAGALGFTPTGTISIKTPVLLFCIAFGLSMDYEVFLLSRIKEEWDLLGDNEEAVARGLQHTGRIVTAAALVMSVVFLGFLTADVSVVKIFGLGLSLAVLVDAFVIRATLVPALMKLAGRANWWAPARLRRLHLLVGFWETEPLGILDLGRVVRVPEPRRPVHMDLTAPAADPEQVEPT